MILRRDELSLYPRRHGAHRDLHKQAHIAPCSFQCFNLADEVGNAGSAYNIVTRRGIDSTMGKASAQRCRLTC
eukprot:954133-Alexandrium_andersonii.AAC.1